MKKILYVNGCSHAAGSEITAARRYWEPEDIKKSWSGKIASKYNLECINDAIPGQGNESILTNTLNSLMKLLHAHDPQDVLVIISWTGFDRVDYIFDGVNYRISAWSNNLKDFGEWPNAVKKAWETTVNGSDRDFVMNRFSIIYFTLYSFLKSMGIDYLFFNAINECYIPNRNLLHTLYNTEINSSLFRIMKSDQDYIDAFDHASTYCQYLKNRNFDGHVNGRLGHFMEDGHQAWFEYLENILLAKKKL